MSSQSPEPQINGTTNQKLDILIVEDDDILREVMEFLLTAAEFSVRSAGNGAQALKLIGERVPSVLVIDVLLPEMTGQEVIEQLRLSEATGRTSPGACWRAEVRARGAGRIGFYLVDSSGFPSPRLCGL